MNEYIKWIGNRIDKTVKRIEELKSETGLTYTEGEYRDQQLREEELALSTLDECRKKSIQFNPANVPSENEIDDFLEFYEMRGETEDGRDAIHAPSEGEKALIKDAIISFLTSPI